MADPLAVKVVETFPIEGQVPGTSGLRKKTRVFMGKNYLENFVQSTFDALNREGTQVYQGTLVVGGDGRFHNPAAIQTILRIAFANGVGRVWLAKDGLLSTPGASALVRERGPRWQRAFGAFILSASHNPGGLEEDFGIKYNCENGGPAPSKVTKCIAACTAEIAAYKICADFPAIDTSTVGSIVVHSADGSRSVSVEVLDGVDEHRRLLRTIFDFAKIRTLLERPDFTFVVDCMAGVNGPYAKRVFCDDLGQSASCLLAAEPLEDFGGGHADPNLTYATRLTAVMGVSRTGEAVPPTGGRSNVPSFGAAFDGDADRNMVLGAQFFVTPSDSLAIIAAHANAAIPFFRERGGLRGVARSMPTSSAVDLVAKRLGLALFETPTGWKFFGNLMDSKELFAGTDYTPLICGEESFGTGSDHVREKDGLWAVLAWLSILAHLNPDPAQPLVGVQQIVEEHWANYGRNYYCRYDYEGVASGAKEMMAALVASFPEIEGSTYGRYTLQKCDEFEYNDPVDGSVASHQGIRLLFSDGSRIIFRLSGTSSAAATIRLYLESYRAADSGELGLRVADALGELVEVALQLSRIEGFTGRKEPTVIT